MERNVCIIFVLPYYGRPRRRRGQAAKPPERAVKYFALQLILGLKDVVACFTLQGRFPAIAGGAAAGSR